MARIELPFPPSVNSIWRSNRGRVHKSEKYEKWLQSAGWTLKSQKVKPVFGPFIMEIVACRPDKRRRDLDNLTKVLSDLLTTHGIIKDDCLACEIHSKWLGFGPNVYVTVHPADEEQMERGGFLDIKV